MWGKSGAPPFIAIYSKTYRNISAYGHISKYVICYGVTFFLYFSISWPCFLEYLQKHFAYWSPLVWFTIGLIQLVISLAVWWWVNLKVLLRRDRIILGVYVIPHSKVDIISDTYHKKLLSTIIILRGVFYYHDKKFLL